jgi:RecA-family ATPase
MSDDFEKWVDSGCPDNDKIDGEQVSSTNTQKLAQITPDRTNVAAEAKGNDRAEHFKQEVDASVMPMTSKQISTKPEKAKTHNSIKVRASELAVKMVALQDIKPVLSSLYLVKDWLDREALSVVYGESNVGKTFFALDLAVHVAAARDWHGYKVSGKLGHTSPVVYVACEGGQGLRNRIVAIRQNDPELAAAAGPNFMLLSTGLDLCGCNDAAALIEVIGNRCKSPSLIIIDTLAMAFGSGDENTAKDMGLFIANCTCLRAETGAHVMVIHHSGKNTSKGARGSGSLRAAADSEIELTRSGDVIMAKDRKQRDKQRGKIFAYKLQSVFLGNDEDGDAVTSAVVETTEPLKEATQLKGQLLIAKLALEDALAAHGQTTPGEGPSDHRKWVSVERWSEHCESRSLSNGGSASAPRTAFHRAKNKLQEKGIVQINGDYVAWTSADE